MTPGSLEEALDILGEKGLQCRIVAGGTDLIPALRNEDIHPAWVVNILEIHELRGIIEEDDLIRIGPTTTFTEMSRSETLKTSLPLLTEAASWVGGRTTRNRGTIGGNICSASPAADGLPAVVALDGLLELRSRYSGTRTLPAAQAVEAPYKTALRGDEMLTAILVRKWPPGHRYAFEKLAARNAMARAYMNLSVVLNLDAGGAFSDVRIVPGVLYLDAGGAFSDVRIVPGALEAVARRAHSAENTLIGQKPVDSVLEQAADVFVENLEGVWIPEYKLPVARSLLKRVLKRALKGNR
jgi:CO/xanthine dehydrogenase FAD-binding subunit